MKIVEKITLKIVILTAVNIRCILHGRVIIISSFNKAVDPKTDINPKLA